MSAPDPAALDLTGFDLRALPPGFHDNPYPWYAALRTQSPVRALPDGSVLLTRYRDCEAVYRDPKLFCSDKKAEFGPKFGANSPLFEHHTTSLVFNDPPLHTRVRRLIAGALTVRATDATRPGGGARPGPARHLPQPESPPCFRLRCAPVRGHEPGAAGGPGGDRAIPAALSGLCVGRASAARRAGAVSG